MTKVAEHDAIREHFHENFSFDCGPVRELLLCPSCENVILRQFVSHSEIPEEREYSYLYPQPPSTPEGVPSLIAKAYDAAHQVRSIDTNAYGVLLGRVLELVCLDRGASGEFLGHRIGDLATKGEIPDKLVEVAKGLKDLRNIGAHASLGELTIEDSTILDDLCRAILAYVYTAPHLSQKVQDRLRSRKNNATTAENS